MGSENKPKVTLTQPAKPDPDPPQGSGDSEGLNVLPSSTAPTSPPPSPIPLELSACRVSPSTGLPEIRPQDATLARPPKPVMQACQKDTGGQPKTAGIRRLTMHSASGLSAKVR